MTSLKISLTQEELKLKRTSLKFKITLKKTVNLLMKPTLLEKMNTKLSSSKWTNTTLLLNQLMKLLLWLLPLPTHQCSKSRSSKTLLRRLNLTSVNVVNSPQWLRLSFLLPATKTSPTKISLSKSLMLLMNSEIKLLMLKTILLLKNKNQLKLMKKDLFNLVMNFLNSKDN